MRQGDVPNVDAFDLGEPGMDECNSGKSGKKHYTRGSSQQSAVSIRDSAISDQYANPHGLPARTGAGSELTPGALPAAHPGGDGCRMAGRTVASARVVGAGPVRLLPGDGGGGGAGRLPGGGGGEQSGGALPAGAGRRPTRGGRAERRPGRAGCLPPRGGAPRTSPAGTVPDQLCQLRAAGRGAG